MVGPVSSEDLRLYMPLSKVSSEDLRLYMPLVRQVVSRVLRRVPPNVLREDLMAAGCVGLLDALRKSADRTFERSDSADRYRSDSPDRGVSFEWYARVRIYGSIMDELRALDWMPRRTRSRTTGSFVARFGDLPEGVVDGLLDRSPSPHENVERLRERVEIDRAVRLLPRREASVVAWYYLDGLQFEVIASRLGVSKPRVSQLHTRALARLRDMLAGESQAA
jgi:RNA polymerase sigma factor FliA